jgi:replicative DNA helicase
MADQNASITEEQMVICGLFAPALGAIYIHEVSDSDLLHPPHKAIVKGLKTIFSKQMVLNPETLVSTAIEADPNLSATIGPYIADLWRYAATMTMGEPNLKYHIDTMRNNTLRDSLLRGPATDLAQQMVAPDASPEKILLIVDKVRDMVVSSRAYKNAGFQTASEALVRWEQEMARRQLSRDFVPTGYSHIDYFLTEGFAAGKVSLVGGRPGCGKSAFVDNCMVRMCNISAILESDPFITPDISPFGTVEPIYCALTALEMNAVGTLDRMAAISTMINLSSIIKNPRDLTADQWQDIERFKQGIGRSKYLFFDDQPRQSVAEMALRVEALKKRMGIKRLVVFIDLFGKLSDMNEEAEESVAHAYEKALREIQIYARELNVHFCLVAQIGRAAEAMRDSTARKGGRIDNRPSIRHLKNAGAFEEVADLIFLLYRQKYYEPSVPNDICEIILAKQRQGVNNKTINLLFDAPTTRMLTTNYIPDYQQTHPGINVAQEGDFTDPRLYWTELVHPEIEEMLRKEAQGQSPDVPSAAPVPIPVSAGALPPIMPPPPLP